MSKNCDLPLHGITVVVDALENRVYIGRYHSEGDDGILLNDVDVRDFETPEARAAHVARSAQFGVFKNTERVKVPRAHVLTVRRLIDCAADASGPNTKNEVTR